VEVKSDDVISWGEVKKILAEKEKKKELGYEQKNALEHLRNFSKLPETKGRKIVEDLGKIEKLRKKHIVSILNFLPETLNDLKILFSSERIVLSEEDKKNIIKIIKDNR
jgi:DNA-directed RNA polymerase subunit F